MNIKLARRMACAGIFLVLALASCGGKSPPTSTPKAPIAQSTGSQVIDPQSTGAQNSSSQEQASSPEAGAGTTAPQASISTPAGTSTPPLSPGEVAAQPTTPSSQPMGSTEATLQRRLGELVFSEGSVSIHRAGSSPQRADIGSVVRAYDVLVTGPESRAEIDIGSGSAGGATIKLAENTAFYFDTKELGVDQRKTVLQLLSGSLAIKVDKLVNGTFQVATDSAILGVRGTVFIVDTIPNGSVLVSCDTGAVLVSAGYSSSTAKPGGVVEISETASLNLIAVQVSELGSYRGEWRAEAYRDFASKAIGYTSSYVLAIEKGKPAFDAALARLRAQKPALDAWRSAKAAGKSPRFSDWIAEKKAVSAALFDCLKALFALERPYYRLIELKTLHAAGTGVGTLSDGRSSAAYFDAFDASTRELSLGMSMVREALTLFSWVSDGSPLGEFFGSKAEGLGTGSLLFDD